MRKETNLTNLERRYNRLAKNEEITPERIGLAFVIQVYQFKEFDDQSHKNSNYDYKNELALLSSSFRCSNCGIVSQSEKLYCSEFCSQTAGTVRYARKAIDENRISLGLVFEGIGIRLQHNLLGGAYPAVQRRLSSNQRKEIFLRDNHICQLCGKSATEIDHIIDSSNEKSNLRALCKECNLAEAQKRVQKITNDSDKAKADKIWSDLVFRVASKEPIRLCDDHSVWNKVQSTIRFSRKKLSDGLDNDFEDVDGYLEHTMKKDD